ncbi:MAG: CheR family methyltransferase [Thermodesulfobacteriota bacterium]
MTRMEPEAPDYREQILEELAALVQERTGLAYGPRGRAALRRVVEVRLKALDSIPWSDYLSHLRRDEKECFRLALLLTDGRTAFFRNPVQFEVWGSLITDLTWRRHERVLTLVSAGCATGEEAWSMAMLVWDLGLIHKGWLVRIYGLDLNPEFTAKARAGVYPASARPNMPAEGLRRWFKIRGQRLQVRNELKAIVSFAAVNLLRPDELPWPDLIGQADAILCKNVLVDLSPPAGRKTAEFLAALAAPAGVVFTAPYEALPYGADYFTTERLGPVVFYRRRSGKIKANPGPVPKKARRKKLQSQPDRQESAARLSLTSPIGTLLRQAAETLNKNLPDEVWPCLEEAWDQAGEGQWLVPEILGLAARANLTLSRWAEARALAVQIINHLGDRPWPHLLLSEAWSGVGQDDLAAKESARAEEMLAADPACSRDPYFELDRAAATAAGIKAGTG